MPRNYKNGFRGTTVVITGAGSGIGRATALAFAAKGAKLLLCDINQAALNGTKALVTEAGGSCILEGIVDVADFAQVERFAEAAGEVTDHIDILVNNAGIGLAGMFLDASLEAQHRTMDINYWGVVHGVRAFGPGMLERQRGHIVNISSMLGFTPTIGISGYSASKFAVLGLSECLRLEFGLKNVGVSAVCPGMIKTNIIRDMLMEGGGRASTEKERAKVGRMFEKRNFTPDRVAAAVLDAVKRDISIRPVAPEAWVMYYIRRFLPWLSTQLAKMGPHQRLNPDGDSDS